MVGDTLGGAMILAQDMDVGREHVNCRLQCCSRRAYPIGYDGSQVSWRYRLMFGPILVLALLPLLLLSIVWLLLFIMMGIVVLAMVAIFAVALSVSVCVAALGQRASRTFSQGLVAQQRRE